MHRSAVTTADRKVLRCIRFRAKDQERSLKRPRSHDYFGICEQQSRPKLSRKITYAKVEVNSRAGPVVLTLSALKMDLVHEQLLFLNLETGHLPPISVESPDRSFHFVK